MGGRLLQGQQSLHSYTKRRSTRSERLGQRTLPELQRSKGISGQRQKCVVAVASW